MLRVIHPTVHPMQGRLKMKPRTRPTKRGLSIGRRGITLVETLIASTILASASLTVTYAVVAGQSQVRASEDILRAVDLGEDLMDEILRLPYDDPNGASDPGPEDTENARTDFDNTDDYHGYVERANGVIDSQGDLYSTAYQGFIRRVSVTASTQFDAGLGVDIDGLIVRVFVNNTTGIKPIARVVRFVPEYAP